MPYYIRVLTTNADPPSMDKFDEQLRGKKFDSRLVLEAGTSAEWTQLLLSHADGTEIAVIERCSVEPESLALEELDEFRDEIADERPGSAVPWLLAFFDRVQCIYAIQVLHHGVDHLNGWDILGCVQDLLWSRFPAIIQTDGEGFTNEDGYHILWQFNDKVAGSWNMAVRIGDEWSCFEMELGDRAQRDAFMNGRVPPTAKPVV